MKKPVLHLICNAHLDPVWQWRWEEGAAEAVATFGVAARLLREFPTFIFNHNEAILYRWVKDYDPTLFREIQSLVHEGRWCITGGWYLQPDVNMPGTEALIRHVIEGRRFFREHFHVSPVVAYNFDSFGHCGGLPSILVRSGFAMYMHARPGEKDLSLPSDLYRWRGVDGSEVAAYRLPSSGFNTSHGKVVERINEMAEIALQRNRDTPVFWGLGDHGGGATRAELEHIHEYMQKERRVEIVHSSPERFFEAVRPALADAPLVEGDLQRVFTGCYTSMSRLKRRMQQNLGELTQVESLRAATWWMRNQPYPVEDLQEAWHDHLFNDFHDILAGSSIEAAETDALDSYGRSSQILRRARFGAATSFNGNSPGPATIALTVLNANPSASTVPVEVEYMIDHMPRFDGAWHVRLFTLDGRELRVQEEAPDSLLFKDAWRRKVCFNASLPHVGAAHFRLELCKGPVENPPALPLVRHSLNPQNGLLAHLDAGGNREVLGGDAPQALVVEDLGDSWGGDVWSYRTVVGRFEQVKGSFHTVQTGPVRTISETCLVYGGSKIVLRAISYAGFPFLEFRFRIQWNEEQKRLKLAFPTIFRTPEFICEIPGGAINRPADGEEHVQGRWTIIRERIGGKDTALGLINNGQYGIDVHSGEIRLSVLRSAAFCHEHSFPREGTWNFMDQGVHEVRLLLTAGDYDDIRRSVAGLADWISTPPFALAHLPVDEATPPIQELLTVRPANLRLTACKQSWDGASLIVRCQETAGVRTDGVIELKSPTSIARLVFEPFAITTLRFERTGAWKEVSFVEES